MDETYQTRLIFTAWFSVGIALILLAIGVNTDVWYYQDASGLNNTAIRDAHDLYYGLWRTCYYKIPDCEYHLYYTICNAHIHMQCTTEYAAVCYFTWFFIFCIDVHCNTQLASIDAYNCGAIIVCVKKHCNTSHCNAR